MDNGGFQVFFQTGSGANPASHAMGTSDSFPEFKVEEVRGKRLHIVLRFRMSVTVPLLLRDGFTLFQGRLFEEFLSYGGKVKYSLVLKCQT
jgi:hypothetical protein